MRKVSKRDPCGELPSYFENYAERGKKLDVAAFGVRLMEGRKPSPHGPDYDRPMARVRYLGKDTNSNVGCNELSCELNRIPFVLYNSTHGKEVYREGFLRSRNVSIRYNAERLGVRNKVL
jgi:hypothetical protein